MEYNLNVLSDSCSKAYGCVLFRVLKCGACEVGSGDKKRRVASRPESERWERETRQRRKERERGGGE